MERWAPYDSLVGCRVVKCKEGLNFVSKFMGRYSNEQDGPEKSEKMKKREDYEFDKLSIKVNLGQSDGRFEMTQIIKSFFKSLRTYKVG